MKGRSRIAIFFSIIGLMLVSFLPGYSNTDGTYLVRKGDNLTTIAKKFGTSPAALRAANGLRGSLIRSGQILRIPGLEAAPQIEKEVLSRETASPAVDASVLAALDSKPEEELPTRLRLVKAGFQLLGVRYRFSGLSEKSGLDCSGLVKILFSKFNIDVPRSSREQFKQGQKVDRSELEPGDLVFFSSGGTQPTHVGIYIGDNKFLHAARKAKRVIVSDLNKIWYTMRYLGARRISDLWEEPATAAE